MATSGGPDIESGSDEVKKCDFCDENFTDGYCCGCEIHMCQPCFDRHLKSKACRHHILSAEQNQKKIDPKTYSEDCTLHKNLYGQSSTSNPGGGLFGVSATSDFGTQSSTFICGKQTSKSKFINKPEQRQKLTKDQIQLAQPPTTQLRNLSTSSNLATSDNGSSFTTPEGIKVLIYMADVLNLDVDCIVRFTDNQLQPVGSVAEAITKAAGHALQNESYANKNYMSGRQVCWTTAGNLRYKCVIHAILPYPHHFLSDTNQQYRDILMQTFLNALLEAERKGMKTIAMPIYSDLNLSLNAFSAQCFHAVKIYSSRNQDGRSTTLSEIHCIATNERERNYFQQAFASTYKQAMV